MLTKMMHSLFFSFVQNRGISPPWRLREGDGGGGEEG